VVPGRGATAELVREIARAGPFGSGNSEPVLALAGHRLESAEPVGEGHVRLRLRSGDGETLSGIAFRAIGQPLGQGLLAARGKMVHAAGHLSLDRWGGQARVQLRLMDAALAEPPR
jgi:single-stranded-DNA-specific exonuclease